jgi:predicted phage-related endonuclease
LKFIVEELERDIERLNKYIKSLDDNLKNEYKKSQMNILDGDSSKREAVSRL